jgi:hypothetical protein
MNRPSRSMGAALFVLAAFVYLGASSPTTSDVSAQETASDVSQTRMRAIQDKIQLAEIRLAIRLQEVEVAKAERRLVATVAGRAVEMMGVEQKLAKTTNDSRD